MPQPSEVDAGGKRRELVVAWSAELLERLYSEVLCSPPIAATPTRPQRSPVVRLIAGVSIYVEVADFERDGGLRFPEPQLRACIRRPTRLS